VSPAANAAGEADRRLALSDIPDRTERPTAFSNPHRPKKFRFCLFGEILRQSN
jgi:hypothetical protein